MHVACLPLLLFLPAYLGYASFTFSEVGIDGGILYPYLVGSSGYYLSYIHISGLTDVDRAILDSIPPVLEPISSSLKWWTVASFAGRMPGPTKMIVFGILLGSVVIIGDLLSGLIRKRSA